MGRKRILLALRRIHPFCRYGFDVAALIASRPDH
jgi:hypothetical protein